LHKALFSPTKSALLQAVKDGHLITWPGLTEDAIHKHLKLTPVTAMGHMNQRRQNIRSTAKAPIADAASPYTYLGTKTNLVHAVLIDQGQLYTDLTGKFPVRSSKGNSYVMVCYVYDCNNVKVIPMKFRSTSQWVKAYDSIHQELSIKGFKPKLQTLDNEASTALKNFFTANDMEYQLVPPHYHRRRYLADVETPSTLIRRSALSWPRGLQQNSFLSARMKNHCTRETRKPTHLGSPRATWIFLGTINASLPVSKCLHLGHG
jgi:hypothetical protein